MDSVFDSKTNPYDANIEDTHSHVIKKEIQKINYRRIRIFSFVVLLFELLLILFYDIPRILKNQNQLAYQLYFILHFATLLASVVSLLFLHRYRKQPEKGMPNFFIEIMIFLFLTFMALVGFLDLFRSGQIISYASMLTLAGITMLIEPPKNYFVYSIPHSLFLGLSFYFIEDLSFLMGHLINSTMYFICILILSRIVYENQFSHIVKNIALKKANQELAYLSNHDPLTKISNRRYFEAAVEEKVLSEEEKQSVLTMVDLDYFKKVNDQYGHSVGDVVLEEVAAIMKRNIREGDLLARWGGEEFIILFSNRSLDQAEKIVERMRKAIEKEQIIVRDYNISITASFGMCKFKNDTEKAMNNCYIKADELLYLAKEKGRNRIEIG